MELLRLSGLSQCRPVISQRASPGANGSPEHRPDGIREFTCP
jgi:hypothetical protein